MAQKLSGGCACGAIHYECNADPVVMLNCHCRDCQHASGSAYAAVVVVPKAAVQLRGEPRYHRIVGTAGKSVERGFCPTCGSQVTMKWNGCRMYSDYRRQAWTTHRFICQRWTCSLLARSPGITWIPPSKNICMPQRSDRAKSPGPKNVARRPHQRRRSEFGPIR